MCPPPLPSALLFWLHRQVGEIGEEGKEMETARRTSRSKWRSIKERLVMVGCCASAWGFRASNPTTAAISDDGGYMIHPDRGEEAAIEETNLATALAAERQYRAETVEGETAAAAAVRVSLLRLLEVGEGGRVGEEAGGGGEGEWWCCVCLGQRKGAAFIPCGHTFCRFCAREVWLSRGSCRLCNRPILDILDIF